MDVEHFEQLPGGSALLRLNKNNKNSKNNKNNNNNKSVTKYEDFHGISTYISGEINLNLYNRK